MKLRFVAAQESEDIEGKLKEETEEKGNVYFATNLYHLIC